MFSAIILIFVFFIISLGLRLWFPRMCAICSAVTLTWLYGLFVGWDVVVLAILMGGSAVGLLYYLGTKFPSGFGFFKLPYLLTALVIIESVLLRSLETDSFLALVGVWGVFLIIYIFRNSGGKNWFKKVVECCKNW